MKRSSLPVGTAVVRPCLWRRAHDDLHAGVGRVVLASALLAVHVAEAVCVSLDELVVRHQLGEVRLPELLRALQVQPLSRRMAAGQEERQTE